MVFRERCFTAKAPTEISSEKGRRSLCLKKELSVARSSVIPSRLMLIRDQREMKSPSCFRAHLGVCFIADALFSVIYVLSLFFQSAPLQRTLQIVKNKGSFVYWKHRTCLDIALVFCYFCFVAFILSNSFLLLLAQPFISLAELFLSLGHQHGAQGRFAPRFLFQSLTYIHTRLLIPNAEIAD